MHPPEFRPDHRLSDWPDCFVEIQCCKGVTMMPVKLLLGKHGNVTFRSLLGRLRCNKCGKPSAPAYLCASHFRRAGGGMAVTAAWAIELVGEPAVRP